MSSASVELIYPEEFYDTVPPPRAFAATGTLTKQLESARVFMVGRMRELISKNPTLSLALAADMAWKLYKPSWLKNVSPLIIQAFLAGMREAHSAQVPERVLVPLANQYAETMGDYFNSSSAEAMQEGYNAYVNKKVPQRAAADRALAGFGMTKRQTRSAVAASAMEPQAVNSLYRLDPRRKIKQFVGEAIRSRFQLFETEEMFRANQHARQLVWLYQFKAGRLPPGTRRMWLTAQDEKVCPSCGPMHGLKSPIDQPFKAPGGGEIWTPSMHVNCRCQVMLWVPTVTLIGKADDDEFDEKLHPRDERGRWTDSRVGVTYREDPFVGTVAEPVKLKPLEKLKGKLQPLQPLAAPAEKLAPLGQAAPEKLGQAKLGIRNPKLAPAQLDAKLRMQTQQKIGLQHHMEELATARLEQAIDRTVQMPVQSKAQPKANFISQSTVNTPYEKNAYVELANSGYKSPYDWVEGSPHEPTFMVLREPMDFAGAGTPWQDVLGFDEQREQHRLFVEGTVYDLGMAPDAEHNELSDIGYGVDEHGNRSLLRWRTQPDDDRLSDADVAAVQDAYDIAQMRLDEHGESLYQHEEYLTIPGIEVDETGKWSRSAREFTPFEIVEQLGMRQSPKEAGSLYARVFRIVTFDPRHAEPSGSQGNDLRISRGAFRVEDMGMRDGVQLYELYAVDPMDE